MYMADRIIYRTLHHKPFCQRVFSQACVYSIRFLEQSIEHYIISLLYQRIHSLDFHKVLPYDLSIDKYNFYVCFFNQHPPQGFSHRSVLSPSCQKGGQCFVLTGEVASLSEWCGKMKSSSMESVSYH